MKGPDASSQAGAPQRKEVLSGPSHIHNGQAQCHLHCNPKHLHFRHHYPKHSHPTAEDTKLGKAWCHHHLLHRYHACYSSILSHLCPLGAFPSFLHASHCVLHPPQQLLQLCSCSTRTTPIPFVSGQPSCLTNYTHKGPFCVCSAEPGVIHFPRAGLSLWQARKAAETPLLHMLLFLMCSSPH